MVDPGDGVESDDEDVTLETLEAGASRTADSVAPDPDVGDQVGGYQLLERLGRGGTGTVFQARSPDNQICALKVLSAVKVRRARVVQRFFDEVRAANAVAHPGLIRVLDFVEEENPRRLAYAMEYLDGESLRARLKREATIGLREAIDIAGQICDALEALHSQGIVHRDLKPENIFLSHTVVKLLDFGVVKFLPLDPTHGSRESEKPGTFVGTPRYMAPEQAAGTAVDGRADLFSVGVILFEMITGRCPHEGDSLRDVVLAKLKGAPPIQVDPGKELLPQELTALVDACLQLKPQRRPSKPQEVAGILRNVEMILFAVGTVRQGADGKAIRDTDAIGDEPTTDESTDEDWGLPPEITELDPVQPKKEPSAAQVGWRWQHGVAMVMAMVLTAIGIAFFVHRLTRSSQPVVLGPKTVELDQRNTLTVTPTRTSTTN